mgnify:CR=1 FL=1
MTRPDLERMERGGAPYRVDWLAVLAYARKLERENLRLKVEILREAQLRADKTADIARGPHHSWSGRPGS